MPRSLTLPLTVALVLSTVTACTHLRLDHPAASASVSAAKVERQALIKRAGRYRWRLQLTVTSDQSTFVRRVWLTMPYATPDSPLPLDLCEEVSAKSQDATGAGVTQPGGPRWVGYLICDPRSSPPQLEIRCIERSDCACRHYHRSELDGTYAVSRAGTWRTPPR